MMRMMCLVALGLLLAGCAGQATPTPVTVEVTRVVAVPVTRVVTVPVTRVVTATLRPEPTATMTPTAAAVVAPAGWVTYTHPTGLFSMRVPAGTGIRDESMSTVSFEFANDLSLLVGMIDRPIEVGSEEAIDALVIDTLTSQSLTGNAVRVTGRGSLASPLAANYVEWTTTNSIYRLTVYHFEFDAPLPGANSVRAMLSRANLAVTEAERQAVGTMLATLRVR